MTDLDALAHDPVMGPHLPVLAQLVNRRTGSILSGNKKGIALARVVDRLPVVKPASVDVGQDRIRIGASTDLDADQRAVLREGLCGLKPWRKGPFEIFGIPVDSEWDSAIKWNRLADHLGDLEGKRVLDIGSSCGYYLFRLADRDPGVVVGLEPSLTMYFQYLALSRYVSFQNIHCLPLKLEELPGMPHCFDTVLCMGMLYHRRSPLDTLRQIHALMAPGGQLVVETLILEGDQPVALFPEQRYARMKNVFFIPTVTCLSNWLVRCGFDAVRCVDVSPTTTREQRKTEWIDTHSLSDFLDPADPCKTIEGYPAPVRAMVLASARPR